MSAYEEPGEVAQLIGLTHIFTPAQAAEVLRSIGLDDITECALRTRAYRKQIPFHLNGHRIIFTIADLREIAEGTPCRPPASQDNGPREPAAAPERVKAPRADSQDQDVWRAKRPRHA